VACRQPAKRGHQFGGRRGRFDGQSVDIEVTANSVTVDPGVQLVADQIELVDCNRSTFGPARY